MNKFFFYFYFIVFLLFPLNAFAVEEVSETLFEEIQLDVEEEKLQFEKNDFQKKYLEKKVYFDKEDKLKLHLDGYLVEEVKLGVAYIGQFDINFLKNPTVTNMNYDSTVLDTWAEGRFKNGKTSFKVNINPVRYVPNKNYMATLWQDFWLKHDLNKNQSVQAGYYRTPNGVEGSVGTYFQDFACRSQIARTFANSRAIGVKNSGRYKYIDYDLGVFDSARYFDSFLNGFEFVGKVVVKPLEFADGKYGHLKVAGSLNSGNKDHSYNVVNAYIGYQYKKFSIDAEYAHANGYNGAVYSSRDEAQGFYNTIKYELSPKLHLLARYDIFDPNMKISGNNIEEYSVGVNYFPKGRFFKLSLNYVFRQNHSASNSNRLILLTQIVL